MPKFFVNSDQIDEKKVTIIGEDVNHIKNVLRLKVDDNIQVCNKDSGINYECGINLIEKDYIQCIIFKELNSKSEPENIYINIFQGLPKQEKMEFLLYI